MRNSEKYFHCVVAVSYTHLKEIPHYKPRGKMIYFAKEDLDEWLLQNYEPTVDEAARMANNLNQLTKLSHQTGFYRTKNIVMELLAKLKEVLSDYKEMCIRDSSHA